MNEVVRELDADDELSRFERLVRDHAEPIGDLAFMEARVKSEGVLLRGQRKYLSSASKHSLVVAEKARRVGLTWAEAGDDVLYAASRAPHGSDVNYVGTSKEMAREYIEAAADWARAFNKAASDIVENIFHDKATPGSSEEDRVIQVFTIEFDSGNKIQALSSNPRSFRGRKGRAVIDEAAFHDDLEGLIKAAGAFIIRGGDVRVISTHNGVDSYYNQIIGEINGGKRGGYVYRYDFEDAVRDGLYESLCLQKAQRPNEDRPNWLDEDQPTRDGKIAWLKNIFDVYKDDVEEELFCVPARSGGTYMSRALIESCKAEVPVVRWSQPSDFTFYEKATRQRITEIWCEENLLPILRKLDPRREHVFGSDFARSGDQSIMWFDEISKALKLEARLVIELDNIPTEQQQQILFYCLDRLPRFRKGAMDATGNGEYLAESARQTYGASLIDAVRFSESWYRENMPPFKSAFEDDDLTVPADSDIIDDIHMFRVINGVARMPKQRVTGKGGSKRHGDAGIARVLSHFASRQDSVIIEHGGGPRRASVGAAEMQVDESVGFGVVYRDSSGEW